MTPSRPASIRALETVVWALAWSLLVLAIVGSLTPQEPAGFSFSDKVTHALGYMGLTCSFLLAAVWMPVRGPGRFPHSALAVTVAVAAVGALIELLQGAVGRTPDVYDLVANLSGSVCGRLLWGALRGAFSERSG
jgi:VanZ family protein